MPMPLPVLVPLPMLVPLPVPLPLPVLFVVGARLLATPVVRAGNASDT